MADSIRDLESKDKHQSDFNLMIPWPATPSSTTSSPTMSPTVHGSHRRDNRQRSSDRRMNEEEQRDEEPCENANEVSLAPRRITRSFTRRLPHQASIIPLSGRKELQTDGLVIDDCEAHVAEDKEQHDRVSIAGDNTMQQPAPKPASKTACQDRNHFDRVTSVKAEDSEMKCTICSSAELGDRPRRNKGRALCSNCCDIADERLKAKTVS